MASTTTEQQQSTSVWQLDPVHSSVEFAVKHMMMTTVRGRFRDVQANIHADRDNPERGKVEVVIAVASLDTGDAGRDQHLKSADFFDADNHPNIIFRSKSVGGVIKHPPGQARPAGEQFRMTGELIIRDTPIEITLDCVFDGRGKDPWGKDRAGFTARGQVDRREWGLRWNQALETGGVLVANSVRIEVEAQFVRQEE